MRSLAALCTLLCLPLAQAEYRVHLLEIRHVDTGAKREVASTLDHFQYPEYHPVSPRELVILKDHWMCYGRTDGHKPLCPAPSLEPVSLENQDTAPAPLQ